MPYPPPYHATTNPTVPYRTILHLRRAIYDAQDAFLRHAKFLVSRRTFPAYFTLVPEKTLPFDYFPQARTHCIHPRTIEARI